MTRFRILILRLVRTTSLSFSMPSTPNSLVLLDLLPECVQTFERVKRSFLLLMLSGYGIRWSCIGLTHG